MVRMGGEDEAVRTSGEAPPRARHQLSDWLWSLRSPGSWLQRRLHARAGSEPSAALFRGLRLRLTIWYGAVLAATLLVVGVSLYVALQHQLLDPIGEQLSAQTAILARDWARVPTRPCPGTVLRQSLLPVYVACFGANGNLLGVGPIDSARGTPPQSFLQGTLVARALTDGSASDTVDGGQGVGMVYRYAAAVTLPLPGLGQSTAVIQVGQSVSQVESLLAQLRRLMLVFGVSSLALATVGGLWLSNRALAPARLAFARQQAFIADASHELRTPLTLLRADAEVLLRHRIRFPAEDAEFLEDIVGETEHMTLLSNNLLALARLDAGRLGQERDIVDLSRLMLDAGRRVSALAAEKQLTIRRELAPEATVLGDSAALEQAILIFIDNALKYTPAGGTVTLSTVITGGRVRAAVSDTGIGIDADHLPRLSERFYRVDVARSRAAGGAGLGLAIARGIATAHDGSFEIESEPGKGTTVSLSLPLARRARAADTEVTRSADPSTGSGSG